MRRIRNLVFALVFGLGGAAALFGLGAWQFQRLAWKEALIAELQAKLAAPPAPVDGSEQAATDNFHPASATGRFVADAPTARFLTSLPPFGPGWRLVSAFQLENGARILVDRGFVPENAAPPPPPSGETRLEGALHWPREVGGFTPEPNLAQNLWFARDVGSLAAALGARPVLLILSAPPPHMGAPDWPRPLPVSVDLPNDHLGYAITWCSMGVIWLVMTAMMIRRGE